jgi:hypothetical protein
MAAPILALLRQRRRVLDGSRGGAYTSTTSPILHSGDQRMKNVEMKIDGTILTITVDLAKEFGPSASGKTIIIASTEGNVPVLDRDEKIGLNIYKKR